MIKESTQQKHVTMINIYTPNIGEPQYIRQMLRSVKGEIKSNTIIVGDFNAWFTHMDRLTKQKMCKETQVLNDTMDLRPSWYLQGISPQNNGFHFSSSAKGTFSRIGHILHNKSSLGKFKNTEIISNIFSDHNVITLEVNWGRKKNYKKHKHMEAKNYAPQ